MPSVRFYEGREGLEQMRKDRGEGIQMTEIHPKLPLVFERTHRRALHAAVDEHYPEGWEREAAHDLMDRLADAFWKGRTHD